MAAVRTAGSRLRARPCDVAQPDGRTRQSAGDGRRVSRRPSAIRRREPIVAIDHDPAGHQVREWHAGSAGPAAVAQGVQVHTHLGRRGRVESY